MPSATRILLMSVALASIGAIVFLPTCGLPSPEPPTRDVVDSVASPSGKHLATVVRVSGGGAAGYDYRDVVLEAVGSGEPVEIAHRIYGVRVAWIDGSHLRVDFQHGSVGVASALGVKISYRKDPE